MADYYCFYLHLLFNLLICLLRLYFGLYNGLDVNTKHLESEKSNEILQVFSANFYFPMYYFLPDKPCSFPPSFIRYTSFFFMLASFLTHMQHSWAWTVMLIRNRQAALMVTILESIRVLQPTKSHVKCVKW